MLPGVSGHSQVDSQNEGRVGNTGITTLLFYPCSSGQRGVGCLPAKAGTKTPKMRWTVPERSSWYVKCHQPSGFRDKSKNPARGSGMTQHHTWLTAVG